MSLPLGISADTVADTLQDINLSKAKENASTFTFGQGNKFDSAKDIEPYLLKLRNTQNVQEIITSGNTFGIEACKAFASVLAQAKTLKTATFSDMFTGRLREEIPIALKAMCDALIDHENLIELNLSDNAFGPAGAEPMQQFLERNRHFQTLRLNNNGLGVTGGTIIAKALLAAAEKNKANNRLSSLRTIICGRNRLENGSSQALAKAFAAHGSLTEVRMPQNGIRPEGIQILVKDGLSKNPNLKVLDLQDNTFTASAAQALAEALPSWPEMQWLNISDCLLSAQGGLILAQALQQGKNTSIHTLQLQYGEIDDRGIAALAKAIDSHLSNLSKLDLNGNALSPESEAIQDVIAALKKHGHQEALDELDDMEFDDDEDDDEGEVDEDDEENDPDKAQVVKDAEAAENQPVAQESSKETDDLADALSKTKI